MRADQAEQDKRLLCPGCGGDLREYGYWEGENVLSMTGYDFDEDTGRFFERKHDILDNPTESVVTYCEVCNEPLPAELVQLLRDLTDR